MLAYLVRRKLAKAWRELNVTAEEGMKKLSTLRAMEHEINGSQTGGMSAYRNHGRAWPGYFQRWRLSRPLLCHVETVV
jgi:hypothetical protein